MSAAAELAGRLAQAFVAAGEPLRQLTQLEVSLLQSGPLAAFGAIRRPRPTRTEPFAAASVEEALHAGRSGAARVAVAIAVAIVEVPSPAVVLGSTSANA